ncbi:MAG: hypothetical protein HC875_12625 [Anaerolineales bacterium]|nr:hypothetical protein [Anaerolineales bacterium]
MPLRPAFPILVANLLNYLAPARVFLSRRSLAWVRVCRSRFRLKWNACA